jgi:hypothetical protein
MIVFFGFQILTSKLPWCRTVVESAKRKRRSRNALSIHTTTNHSHLMFPSNIFRWVFERLIIHTTTNHSHSMFRSNIFRWVFELFIIHTATNHSHSMFPSNIFRLVFKLFIRYTTTNRSHLMFRSNIFRSVFELFKRYTKTNVLIWCSIQTYSGNIIDLNSKYIKRSEFQSFYFDVQFEHTHRNLMFYVSLENSHTSVEIVIFRWSIHSHNTLFLLDVTSSPGMA